MILVLNLKMNLTKNNIIDYERLIHNKNVIVMPQYPYLLFFNREGKSYSLGAQDVSKYSKGSYTGEVCAKGLKSLGVKYCLVGHSERKEYFDEKLEDFRMKIQNVMDNDMVPIYCISQSEEEYMNDKELKEIENQLEAIPNYLKYIIIAFEPTWLIGSTDLNIDYDHINKVMVKIKDWLIERHMNHSIIYGGGVSSDNIDELKKLNCVDGFIISSSALDEEEIEKIYKNIND
ncbi:MAG: triosephosphate isomerase [Bacilli bacterium]|nr:triosephosphate isomerase [Bacilli bacterium]